MDTRRKVAICVFLVAAGVAAGVLFRGPILRAVESVLPASVRDWDEQVRLDAISLLPLLRPEADAPATLADQAEFRAAWESRRSRYPPERVRDLRGRLLDYLAFVEAENADCADVFTTGRRPDGKSDGARAARERVAAAFGEFARTTLLPQADALREEAFRESPAVAPGNDPDRRDFRAAQRELSGRLPRLRALVDELTGDSAPPR